MLFFQMASVEKVVLDNVTFCFFQMAPVGMVVLDNVTFCSSRLHQRRRWFLIMSHFVLTDDTSGDSGS